MVVDWVRDFRPTGGELGYESLALHKSIVNTYKRGRSGRKPASFRDAQQTVVVGEVDAADSDAIAAFKGAKPSYKVFPWGTSVFDQVTVRTS